MMMMMRIVIVLDMVMSINGCAIYLVCMISLDYSIISLVLIMLFLSALFILWLIFIAFSFDHF